MSKTETPGIDLKLLDNTTSKFASKLVAHCADFSKESKEREMIEKGLESSHFSQDRFDPTKPFIIYPVEINNVGAPDIPVLEIENNEVIATDGHSKYKLLQFEGLKNAHGSY